MKIDKTEIRRRFKIANDLFRKEFLEERRRLRMTQVEIAEIFGVSQALIARWEEGNSHPYCEMPVALQVMREMKSRKNERHFGNENRHCKYTKEENDNFIEMFKKERKRLRMTMREMSKILGVTFQAICHWEHGICQPTCTWEYILETLANHSATPRQ